MGRGARDGNTSSFKLGVIERLDAAKGKARVHWLYARHWDDQPVEIDSHGTCDVHSLFHVVMGGLDADLKARLMQHAIHYSIALAGDN
ncbi:hypothetical protein BH790_gp61 [Gordonia phage Gsput1]|uniref:Uncharacterized protein n=1 Tax=Gordonia phage Gsput1 TaxID=1622193 RepID=A0A0E3T6A4_9CAUD|nr:hypothetical protein BH790_gp61 [Gordonia phage Gsput1]AKC03086.1 hypothetical protein Gsput1_61 [Gordonia phage Gsput1]